MDSIKRNQKFTGYHGSNQIVRFTFGPYTRKGEQEQRGFSFSVTKESKEDSTEKVSFLIGFSFGEAELLSQHLSHLLSDSFSITDVLIEKSFQQNAAQQNAAQQNAVQTSAPDRSPSESSELSDEEDDLW